MRLWDYISDNKIILLVCFASSLFFSVILISFGVGVAEVFLLWVCFAIILFLTMLCSYLKQRKRMKHLLSNFDSLDQKYLIAEIGIGIKPSELCRVFDKGFIGSNGRTEKNSTGIGLYLCDQLCAKLGIGIDIKSEVGVYTTVLLHFPKSDHLNV